MAGTRPGTGKPCFSHGNGRETPPVLSPLAKPPHFRQVAVQAASQRSSGILLPVRTLMMAVGMDPYPSARPQLRMPPVSLCLQTPWTVFRRFAVESRQTPSRRKQRWVSG